MPRDLGVAPIAKGLVVGREPVDLSACPICLRESCEDHAPTDDPPSFEPREFEALSLSNAERDALSACEAVIEAGRETFLQVGAALLTIRDRRLYREGFDTFEAYVSGRWGLSRSRAYRLIEAAGVAHNLLVSPTGDIRGLNERQTRELAPLSPDEQRLVYDVARSTAPDGRITAAHLKSLIDVLSDLQRLGAIDEGDGIMVPWANLSPKRKLALLQCAVTEETFERYERQREAIRNALTSSASVEWYTPLEYVEAARNVLGTIDLDPASSAQANETVKAARFFTADDDGLAHEWPGRIFLNPPYGGRAGHFVAHLLDQYARGITTAAIVLLSGNSTDTAWFRRLFDHTLCFAGRLAHVPQGLRPSAAFSATWGRRPSGFGTSSLRLGQSCGGGRGRKAARPARASPRPASF